jgi:hypothetical protein
MSSAIHVQFLKFQKVAICRTFMQYWEEISRLCPWHALCNFVVGPNWGFWYIGDVFLLPINEQPNNLSMNFWRIYEKFSQKLAHKASFRNIAFLGRLSILVIFEL